MGSNIRRLSLSLKRGEALHATSISIRDDKLVYVLVTDKKLKYEKGKSRIAYIGTTKNGVTRVAQSVAARAENILAIHGVQEFGARIITCKGRQKVKTWKKLERALLIQFRRMYGEVPLCNTRGKKMKETDEFKYFSIVGVKSMIEELT